MHISARTAAMVLGGLVVAGSAAALYAMWTADSGDDSNDVVRSTGDPALAAIERTLYDYRSNWDPRSRQRWLEEARGKTEAIASGLTLVLERRGHPMMHEAITLTAALPAPSLRPKLLPFTTDKNAEIRAAAIESADSLEPFSKEELIEWLGAPEPAVRIAALHCAAHRDDPPWPEIFRCFASDDPKVQEAAIAAIPEELPQDAIDALSEMSQRVDGQTAIAMIHSLAHVRLDKRIESMLTLFLRDSNSDVVVAALDALGTTEHLLENPESVRELAFDPTRGTAVRAAAFYCLERTGSYEADEILEAIPGMDPWVQYYAGRCLIRARSPEAPRVLLDLIDEPNEGGTVDVAGMRRSAGERADVAVAARQVLAWLTGKGPNSTRREFEAALSEQDGDWNGRRMPAAPPR